MRDERLDFVRLRMEEALGGLSVEAFCEQSGGRFTRNTLRNWFNGKTSPGVDDLVAFADKTGRELSFFVPPTGVKPPISIPKLDVRAAAGAGALNGLANVEDDLEFPHWMLAALGVSRERLHILRAHGDSMEPTICSGALLLVDGRAEARKPPERPTRDPLAPPNDIFVFSMAQELRVKRVHKATKGLVVISDNRAYDPEFVLAPEREGFKIHGRVVWWSNWL